jgi:hypothetical protein
MMFKYFCTSILFLIAFTGCRQSEKAVQIPDISAVFKSQLHKADSTLVVDSLYLIGMDTMTERTAILHTRFPYFHILSKLDGQIENLKRNIDSTKGILQADDLQKMEDLKDERKYVGWEIDSLNSLLARADSVKPVGYRVIYKLTVHKPDSFTISDTIAYALSTDMVLSDWNRNVEKAIDSISAGHHAVSGAFNIK